MYLIKILFAEIAFLIFSFSVCQHKSDCYQEENKLYGMLLEARKKLAHDNGAAP